MSLFDLKPCPFCGNNKPVLDVATLKDEPTLYAQVLCPKCHVATTKYIKKPCWDNSNVEDFMRLAIEHWNKRTPEENK